jgi:uncharacterized UPF0160 family protein
MFKKIGTHNGVFHCDEVVACYLLKLLSPNAEIIRSRDNEVLDKCDIVVDVGNKFDPKNNRYDHHQAGFVETMSTIVPGKTWTTKLSSAGLVYGHFGKGIIKKLLVSVKDSDIDSIFDYVYDHFVHELDGIDNGIPMFDGEPKYRINTGLSSRVQKLNKNWTQEEFDEEAAFQSAMKLAGKEFEDCVMFSANVWLPGRTIVQAAIDNRFETHSSGLIIELSSFCPWEEHFFFLEKEMGIEPTIKYVLFTDKNGSWRVRAVPLSKGNFLLRIPLLKSWCGLRDEELSTVSGIGGCIFAHSSGFIGGNLSKDGALKMALKCIELSKEDS